MPADSGEVIAFRMFLLPGQAAEYQRRHDAIWPELCDLLRAAGISDYRIFLDAEHHVLFATLHRTAQHGMDRLADQPVMQRWWRHMADLMRTNADGSPVVETLPCLFHLA